MEQLYIWIFGAKLNDALRDCNYSDVIPRLEPGALKPMSAQPNPWFDFAIGKIANGFNF